MNEWMDVTRQTILSRVHVNTRLGTRHHRVVGPEELFGTLYTNSSNSLTRETTCMSCIRDNQLKKSLYRYLVLDGRRYIIFKYTASTYS